MKMNYCPADVDRQSQLVTKHTESGSPDDSVVTFKYIIADVSGNSVDAQLANDLGSIFIVNLY